MTGFQSPRLVIFVFPRELSILNVFLKTELERWYTENNKYTWRQFRKRKGTQTAPFSFLSLASVL